MAVSGVVSRKVLPACGGLCYLCHRCAPAPGSLSSATRRSSPTSSPQHRKRNQTIGGLGSFAKLQITAYLEQRCYKELRNEQYGFAKIVVLIYRKLLVSCKEQMPLLASSLLTIIHTLLDQTKQDDMRIIGCETFFFILLSPRWMARISSVWKNLFQDSAN